MEMTTVSERFTGAETQLRDRMTKFLVLYFSSFLFHHGYHSPLEGEFSTFEVDFYLCFD